MNKLATAGLCISGLALFAVAGCVEAGTLPLTTAITYTALSGGVSAISAMFVARDNNIHSRTIRTTVNHPRNGKHLYTLDIGGRTFKAYANTKIAALDAVANYLERAKLPFYYDAYELESLAIDVNQPFEQFAIENGYLACGEHQIYLQVNKIHRENQR